MRQKTILAVGADIKNRFLVAQRQNMRLGPLIGDLSDAGNFERFRKEVRYLLKRMRATPDIIAHDLHPGYFSTRFATTLYPKPYSLIPVQHHHAHIASVMCEHKLTKPVVGVSFDGTGFGTDAHIWGGEFLLVDKNGFKRCGHLKYIKMPGGDQVVRQPWRMVLSILGRDGMRFIKDVNKKEKDIVLSMLSKDINSPLTSSAGRLFDAAAALVGICQNVSYEAEGPIKLEAICKDGIAARYAYRISKHNGEYIIDTQPTFVAMAKALTKKTNTSVIATKFHNTMSAIIIETVKKLSTATGIKDVALSGGVFQNKFLMTKTIQALRSGRYRVFINEMPANDLNIALGQYYVVLSRLLCNWKELDFRDYLRLSA